jgi:taurine dioxygenase
MRSVRRIAYALGAEVHGVDLGGPFDEETVAAIREALVEHQVLVFRDQRLVPEELLSFSARFGPLRPLRNAEEILPGYPHVIRVANEEDSSTRYYGSAWHSDGLAFAERPDGITFLQCVACPRVGGDSAFANQYLAYEALSVGYRALLADLMWHVPRLPALAHPVVRIHEQSGRPHLYLAQGAKICGFTPDESKGITDLLFQVQTTDRFVYRHAWRRGDVVMWENSTTLHRKIGDIEDGELRVMHRTATVGTIVGTAVDPRTGQPASRAIEPSDVLRLAQPLSLCPTPIGGESEVVVRAGARELSFPGDSREFIHGMARAKRFVAQEATRWTSDGEHDWPSVQEALSVLVADGVLVRDVFGESHRLAFR